MKIAYVYDAVYPWIKGGAEKRVWEISKNLSLEKKALSKKLIFFLLAQVFFCKKIL